MASRAFDEIRPPQPELIADCVHCGFCLETCPTYSLWHEEMDSPRGRIVLIKEGLEPGSELSAELVTHIDRCLGCMACVTACPSGVQYDKLIEDTRAQVERNATRPRSERLLRRFLFETFPHPGRLRALAAPLAVGAPARARARRPLQPRARPLPAAAGDRRPRAADAAASRRCAASRSGPPRAARQAARVALLQGCVQRVFFGDVNEATVRGARGRGL